MSVGRQTQIWLSAVQVLCNEKSDWTNSLRHTVSSTDAAEGKPLTSHSHALAHSHPPPILHHLFLVRAFPAHFTWTVHSRGSTSPLEPYQLQVKLFPSETRTLFCHRARVDAITRIHYCTTYHPLSIQGGCSTAVWRSSRGNQGTAMVVHTEGWRCSPIAGVKVHLYATVPAAHASSDGWSGHYPVA
jgi:hypothetical protein